MALTNTEVAIMNEHDFKSLWEYQKIKEKERIVFNLKANSYLGEFCEQTIYMIAYEFLEERTFMPGTMILAQSKRSPLNLFYKEYFQNMISNFGMKIKKSHDRRTQRKENSQPSSKVHSPNESEGDLSPRQLRIKHFNQPRLSIKK